MVKIENWSITYPPLVDRFTPPEHITQHLHGAVYGHASHTDGSVVTTSRIVNWKGRKVTTRHTEYELGIPDPDYVKWYCNFFGKTEEDFWKTVENNC